MVTAGARRATRTLPTARATVVPGSFCALGRVSTGDRSSEATTTAGGWGWGEGRAPSTGSRLTRPRLPGPAAGGRSPGCLRTRSQRFFGYHSEISLLVPAPASKEDFGSAETVAQVLPARGLARPGAIPLSGGDSAVPTDWPVLPDGHVRYPFTKACRTRAGGTSTAGDKARHSIPLTDRPVGSP